MANYKISQAGIAFIKNEEGCRLMAYGDQVGVLTIGYGHTGTDVKPGMVVSAAKATELLVQDVGKCEAAINKNVKKPLAQNQIDALCSFIFNVGVGGFEGSTLLRVINLNPKSDRIPELFGRWNKGTVKGQKMELKVLTARRGREAALYMS